MGLSVCCAVCMVAVVGLLGLTMTGGGVGVVELKEAPILYGSKALDQTSAMDELAAGTPRTHNVFSLFLSLPPSLD